jgi:Ni/Fe-hydrogenase subunit HybB-like protein
MKVILNELKRFILFFLSELKPKGKIFTPFNIITAPIIILGLILIVFRFAKGLGSVTNLSQDYPWGLWIGFDVITGVALAGGGYVIAFMVYILGLKKYHPVARPAILTALLGYLFYAGALMLDLGRPLNIINPMIGNFFGVGSILFLVAWKFFLYIVALFIEFSPVIAEWAGYERLRKFLRRITIGAVIFGITLSTLHQSGLGALFLLAKGKLHPLWYSNITIFFFISSIFSGLSMVIIEGTISHKVFRSQIEEEKHHTFDELIIGMGRAAAVVMFVYFFLKFIDIVHSRHWQYFTSQMGYLYLIELLGFILLPMVIFTSGVKRKSTGLIKAAAFITIIGVILNRLNVTMIAFKRWYFPTQYFPSWIEFTITATIILAEIWAFRWIVNRMPVLREKGN